MTIEKTRLTQTLGVPDLKLKEIVEEQRLLEAASRWPILNDLVNGYEPARRPINLALTDTPTVQQQSEIATFAKKRSRSLFQSDSRSAAEPEAPRQAAEQQVPSHQLSNVFLRLKHREKAKPSKPDSNLVTV